MIKTCINCNRSEEEVPLISFTFREKSYFVCPGCLPILIHEPHLLADKLPGIAEVPHPDQED
jgi:hypothetical protein